MAMETLKDFVEKAKSDEDLQKKLLELSEKEDSDAVKTLMKEHGVSEAELQALQEQEEVMKTTGELSDELLEQVAGGGCWTNVAGKHATMCLYFYTTDCPFGHGEA